MISSGLVENPSPWRVVLTLSPIFSDCNLIIEKKTLVYHTVNGDRALIHTSKTAKMIEVILLTAPWQNVNVLLSNISITFAVFSIFSSNFINSKSFVTICNQSPTRKMDTWRHRTRDHSTRHRPLRLPTYRRSIVTKSLYPAVSEILGRKNIGFTTLTFQSHVTLSVTWPFDSQIPISNRRSIVTKSLSPAIFEILASKCIKVTTLTFYGRVTSAFMWLLDSQVATSHVTIRFPGTHFL